MRKEDIAKIIARENKMEWNRENVAKTIAKNFQEIHNNDFEWAVRRLLYPLVVPTSIHAVSEEEMTQYLITFMSNKDILAED